MNREHLEQLGRELHITIEIDRSGWLRDSMEIRFILGPGRALHPTALRICGTPVGIALVREADPLGLCKKYNLCLEKLRRLRERCTHAVATQKGPLNLNSPLLEAFQALQNFEDELVRRQYRYMGNHVVTPAVLACEVTHLESLAHELESPIRASEGAQWPRCDVDAVSM